MKLYEATNGYIGFSYVRCYVIAESDERAIELASAEFKKQTESPYSPQYPPSFWENVKVEVLVDDCTKEYVSPIED